MTQWDRSNIRTSLMHVGARQASGQKVTDVVPSRIIHKRWELYRTNELNHPAEWLPAGWSRWPLTLKCRSRWEHLSAGWQTGFNHRHLPDSQYQAFGLLNRKNETWYWPLDKVDLSRHRCKSHDQFSRTPQGLIELRLNLSSYIKHRHWHNTLKSLRRENKSPLFRTRDVDNYNWIQRHTSPQLTLQTLMNQEHTTLYGLWMARFIIRVRRHGFKIKPMNTISGTSVNCFLNPIFRITILSKSTTSACFLDHNKSISCNICTVSTSDTRLLINPNGFSP